MEWDLGWVKKLLGCWPPTNIITFNQRLLINTAQLNKKHALKKMFMWKCYLTCIWLTFFSWTQKMFYVIIYINDLNNYKNTFVYMWISTWLKWESTLHSNSNSNDSSEFIKQNQQSFESVKRNWSIHLRYYNMSNNSYLVSLSLFCNKLSYVFHQQTSKKQWIFDLSIKMCFFLILLKRNMIPIEFNMMRLWNYLFV